MGSLLAILTGITSVAVQSNIAIPTVSTLLKTVRDIWPHKTVDPTDPNAPPKPTNVELIAIMRTGFTEGHAENLDYQADLLAQIEALESAEPTPPTV